MDDIGRARVRTSKDGWQDSPDERKVTQVAWSQNNVMWFLMNYQLESG